MTDPNITNWDNFLRIWAILGPLIVAAVSAVWSRRTKIKDREFEKSLEMQRIERERSRETERLEYDRSREIERFEQINTTKKLDFKAAKQDERYNEAKDACVNFMANSQDYVLKHSDFLTNKTPDLKQASILANEKHNFSYQLVQIIGNDDIKNAASSLMNSSLELLTTYSAIPRNQEKYDNALKAYQAAKSTFSTCSRKYLSDLDPHVE